MDEKRLRTLYKNHVEGRHFYRTFSREYLAKTKKEGFVPQHNPYSPQKKDIIRFCLMLDRLEKKGFHYVYPQWPTSKPTGRIISKVVRKSLRKNYIDLTPNNFNDLAYYQARRGGDIPATIMHIANDLRRLRYPLTAKDNEVINRLVPWCKRKMRFKNATVRIAATSACLEKAHLQRFYGLAYLPSPFGSFKNFSKNILKHGYDTYKPYLSGKKEYYLRFRHKIAPTDFEFI
jgi:hypothetical protein